jgi:hypothetical protein
MAFFQSLLNYAQLATPTLKLQVTQPRDLAQLSTSLPVDPSVVLLFRLVPSRRDPRIATINLPVAGAARDAIGRAKSR